MVVATAPPTVIYRNQSSSTWRLFSASTHQLTGGGGGEVVFLHTAANTNNQNSLLSFLLIIDCYCPPAEHRAECAGGESEEGAGGETAAAGWSSVSCQEHLYWGTFPRGGGNPSVTGDSSLQTVRKPFVRSPAHMAASSTELPGLCVLGAVGLFWWWAGLRVPGFGWLVVILNLERLKLQHLFARRVHMHIWPLGLPSVTLELCWCVKVGGRAPGQSERSGAAAPPTGASGGHQPHAGGSGGQGPAAAGGHRRSANTSDCFGLDSL